MRKNIHANVPGIVFSITMKRAKKYFVVKKILENGVARETVLVMTHSSKRPLGWTELFTNVSFTVRLCNVAKKDWFYPLTEFLKM